jgi:2-polyprenyl-3-methyl-5-hydroxy-6-metoxy-1,4-benzoquinol methylase
MSTFEDEITRGERFTFGQNWRAFLSTMNDERIAIAEVSIQNMLRVDRLDGRSVVDVGSGSGLFSLAARRLGARVHSFDYDPGSVGCTQELRARYFPDDATWKVERGSILDERFIASLGTFDVVYSWGVLHHTGDMWRAIENAASLVAENGSLFIALYNDQGLKSRLWTHVKKVYCSGLAGKAAVSSVFVPYFFSKALAASLVAGENAFSAYKRNRGMSITHDWTDWLGGLPFEVASVEAVFQFLHARGFTLENLSVVNGRLGNNEFVFKRARPRAAPDHAHVS